MPRVARLEAPHCFHHVTAKVGSGEFRLEDDAAKREYLRRLFDAVRRGDYRLLSYVLMDNHVHFGLEVGEDPVSRLMQCIQGAFADWLNKRQGRSGHMWRGRYHEAVGRDASFAAHVIAYHHNNPVRARIVDLPEQARWSSHRAYCGLDPRPPELDVARGLELCGLDDTVEGRRAFGQFTFERLFHGKCDWMTEEWLARTRVRAREAVGASVEVGQTVVELEASQPDGGQPHLVAHAPIVVADSTTRAHCLGPNIDELLAVAAAYFGTSEESLRCRGGGRRSQRFRRVVIWAWVRVLGGRPIDMARALNRSDAAVSQVVRRMEGDASEDARRAAVHLAGLLPR